MTAISQPVNDSCADWLAAQCAEKTTIARKLLRTGRPRSSRAYTGVLILQTATHKSMVRINVLPH
jgi:hypothetical protein